MTATILQFPVKPKENVTHRYTVNGEEVKPPKTHEDYRILLKKYLQPEDYADVLICSLDPDMYDSAEQRIRNVVDVYKSLWYSPIR